MRAIDRRLKRLEAQLTPREPRKPVTADVWFFPERDPHSGADRAAAIAHLGAPTGPRIVIGAAMPDLPLSAFGRPAVRTLEELHGLAS